jgi:uncharacterized membrane protein
MEERAIAHHLNASALPGGRHTSPPFERESPRKPGMTENRSRADGAEPAVASVVERNIAALSERRRKEGEAVGWEERAADAITRFTGSMTFVYLHLVGVGVWVAANLDFIPAIRPFDPTFVILATAASVEAIFLSTFILISQNRMAEADRKRADLALQMNLLAEHEVTKTIALVSAIAERLGIDLDADRRELDELKQEIVPETVLDKIEDSERE